MQLDIHQVAEATKLKSDHIRALEQGQYAVFTAPVYLRGSIRTYAKLLKLDGVKLVQQLDAELSSAGSSIGDAVTPTSPKTPVDSVTLLLSRVNWVVALVIVALVALAVIGNVSYRAWRSHRAADPLKNLGPGIYQPPLNTGETLPLPTNAVRP